LSQWEVVDVAVGGQNLLIHKVLRHF